MEDIDLSDVDPVRRPETLRRITVVQRYLALASPRREDDEAFADELGLGVNQFMLLVRAWRLHGKASAMPGAIRMRQRRATTATSIDPAAAAIVEATIAGHQDAGATEIHEIAAAAAVAAGLGTISFNAVTRRLDAFRRSRLGTPGLEPTLLIGRCAADLPVLLRDGRVVPTTLALAVSRPDGFIMGAACGTAVDMPQVASAIAEAARQSDETAPPAKLLIAVGAGEERTRLFDLLSICDLSDVAEWIDAKTRPDAAVQCLLGAKLGPLRLTAARTQRTWKHHNRLRSPSSEPIREEELAPVISELVNKHNAGLPRSIKPDFSLGSGINHAMLLRGLKALT